MAKLEQKAKKFFFEPPFDSPLKKKWEKVTSPGPGPLYKFGKMDIRPQIDKLARQLIITSLTE